MKYQADLDKAQKLEAEGKNVEAAKIYEEIGTKCLREEGEERKTAPKIIAKSIARYLLAEKLMNAQDLAFQVIFMKDEDPFLSLQIEAAISAKTNLVRAFFVDKLPDELTDDYEVFQRIPQNRKVLKIDNEVTIKKMWEYTVFSEYKKKYDLIEQKFPSAKEMINFILSTMTGITIIGAETASGKKIFVQIAVTFNQDSIEVIGMNTS
ncbi:MAG: hypothetical protein HZR80_06680 [Candidatus Heimdallarchaeota archaeon]